MVVHAVLSGTHFYSDTKHEAWKREHRWTRKDSRQKKKKKKKNGPSANVDRNLLKNNNFGTKILQITALTID